jgi:hypothetical protein
MNMLFEQSKYLSCETRTQPQEPIIFKKISLLNNYFSCKKCFNVESEVDICSKIENYFKNNKEIFKGLRVSDFSEIPMLVGNPFSAFNFILWRDTIKYEDYYNLNNQIIEVIIKNKQIKNISNNFCDINSDYLPIEQFSRNEKLQSIFEINTPLEAYKASIMNNSVKLNEHETFHKISKTYFLNSGVNCFVNLQKYFNDELIENKLLVLTKENKEWIIEKEL